MAKHILNRIGLESNIKRKVKVYDVEKKLITEIMESDTKDELYEEPILSLKETPFAISFSWKDKVIKVELENGEDVLKLATIFSDMLSLNGIPHKVNK
jgi:hypothetical protein